MLWFLRKAFGVVALVWALGWLVSLASCVVSPKAAGGMLAVMYFSNIVGIPASIVWAVLKVISVLGERRAEQPAAAMVWHPPGRVSAGGILRLETSVPVPEAKRITPASPSAPSKPDVYTYSAPGMPMCPECGQRPTIFHCLTHRLAVCLDCVTKHDEAGVCVYMPAFRAPRPTANQATAPPGPVKPPSSILGI